MYIITVFMTVEIGRVVTKFVVGVLLVELSIVSSSLLKEGGVLSQL